MFRNPLPYVIVSTISLLALYSNRLIFLLLVIAAVSCIVGLVVTYHYHRMPDKKIYIAIIYFVVLILELMLAGYFLYVINFAIIDPVYLQR